MNTQMITMGYKNVSLSDKAYDRLRRVKRERESFSDVVLRLLGPVDDISDLFGILSMSDEERESLFEDLDEIWGAWSHWHLHALILRSLSISWEGSTRLKNSISGSSRRAFILPVQVWMHSSYSEDVMSEDESLPKNRLSEGYSPESLSGILTLRLQTVLAESTQNWRDLVSQ